MVDAILLDPALNERQKRVLLDVYASFVRENDDPARSSARTQGPHAKTAAAERPAKKPAAAKKTPARKSTTQ